MTIGKVHVTEKYKRYRQVNPSAFDKNSLRIIRRGKVDLIVGCPKGHYHAGRCSVGTRVQSILKKR